VALGITLSFRGYFFAAIIVDPSELVMIRLSVVADRAFLPDANSYH